MWLDVTWLDVACRDLTWRYVALHVNLLLSFQLTRSQQESKQARKKASSPQQYRNSSTTFDMQHCLSFIPYGFCFIFLRPKTEPLKPRERSPNFKKKLTDWKVCLMFKYSYHQIQSRQCYSVKLFRYSSAIESCGASYCPDKTGLKLWKFSEFIYNGLLFIHTLLNLNMHGNSKVRAVPAKWTFSTSISLARPRHALFNCFPYNNISWVID